MECTAKKSVGGMALRTNSCNLRNKCKKLVEITGKKITVVSETWQTDNHYISEKVCGHLHVYKRDKGVEFLDGVMTLIV